jgi:hypothetical protein
MSYNIEINSLFPPDPEDDDEIVMKTDSLVEWRKLQVNEFSHTTQSNIVVI